MTPKRSQSGLGLMLLAAGRKRGFGYFGTTTDAYLASLAPLLAFALVSGAFTVFAGKAQLGATLTLVSIIGLLAPPVVAHPLCRWWARESAWALYANLLNWTQLLMLLAVSVSAALSHLLAALGLPADIATLLATLVLLLYAFWFQWFVARGALRLTRWRTMLLLTATMLGSNLLIGIPLIMTGDMDAIIAASIPPQPGAQSLLPPAAAPVPPHKP